MPSGATAIPRINPPAPTFKVFQLEPPGEGLGDGEGFGVGLGFGDGVGVGVGDGIGVGLGFGDGEGDGLGEGAGELGVPLAELALVPKFFDAEGAPQF